METWHGFVETLEDAVLLLEACRQGYLRRNQRRLTETEKKRIESGSVYLWDEEEAQIRRWTDCRSWSPSRRRLERFLVCHEIDGHVKPKYRNSEETRSNNDDSDGCTYKRKVGGLCKRCLSVITTDGRRQHLVAYYLEEDVRQGKLSRPFDDSYLSSISVDYTRYPDILLTWPDTSNSLRYRKQIDDEERLRQERQQQGGGGQQQLALTLAPHRSNSLSIARPQQQHALTQQPHSAHSDGPPPHRHHQYPTPLPPSTSRDYEYPHPSDVSPNHRQSWSGTSPYTSGGSGSGRVSSSDRSYHDGNNSSSSNSYRYSPYQQYDRPVSRRSTHRSLSPPDRSRHRIPEYSSGSSSYDTGLNSSEGSNNQRFTSPPYGFSEHHHGNGRSEYPSTNSRTGHPEYCAGSCCKPTSASSLPSRPSAPDNSRHALPSQRYRRPSPSPPAPSPYYTPRNASTGNLSVSSAAGGFTPLPSKRHSTSSDSAVPASWPKHLQLPPPHVAPSVQQSSPTDRDYSRGNRSVPVEALLGRTSAAAASAAALDKRADAPVTAAANNG